MEWREVLGKKGGDEVDICNFFFNSMAALGIALVLSLGDDASEVRATFQKLNSRRDIWPQLRAFDPACLIDASSGGNLLHVSTYMMPA